MKIFVFKTNLQNEYQKKIIAPAINNIKGMRRWSVDFENNILRIEGFGLKPQNIEAGIIEAGFECELI